MLFSKIDHLSDLHKKTDEIKKGCERDVQTLVDGRIRSLEKKLWSIAGGLAVITLIFSTGGQNILRPS